MVREKRIAVRAAAVVEKERKGRPGARWREAAWRAREQKKDDAEA